ncbi:MAG: 4-diphosphocytidyl-2-C-methyl-D-erythritol kinase [Gemmatimonadaceae bacterium]|nr:4-diphosphocytidyl-2-C-methyl-D-erythritol kinase [Gemmatimonadaceae bacterium]
MSAVAARVLAQAKINLFLRVLTREASGFHQLETLFSRISLGDEVVVRVDTDQRLVRFTGDALPQEGLGPEANNLAFRAAAAFAKSTGWPRGFAIEIEKRIPVGGGLGGGSADAGAVLRALNALAPQPLAADELLQLSATLGSDTPFLTQDASPFALAWGRGERLLTLPPPEERTVMLFVFGHGVPTKDAYGWFARTPTPPHGAARLDPRSLSEWHGIAVRAHNDFESVVLPRFRLIELTLSGARKAIAAEHFGDDAVALLSGSGSTVILVGEGRAEQRPSWMFPLSAGVKIVTATTSSRVEPVELID